MKLCLATLALVQAAKNGKGGKHGNRNLENERYVWQTPSCLSNPDLCTLEKTITEESSSRQIVLNQDNYNNYEVRLFILTKLPKRFSELNLLHSSSSWKNYLPSI